MFEKGEEKNDITRQHGTDAGHSSIVFGTNFITRRFL